MKVATAQQMREIDRMAIEKRGIPGRTLMERAGRAVANEALARFEPDSAIVLAGKGNNGGDGFVVARLLHEAGVRCRVELFAAFEELKGDALAQFQALPTGVKVEPRATAEGLAEVIEPYDVIIDALLGTGARGAARGALGEAIEAMNAAPAPIIAIDVPSGLPADGAAPEGPCVRAAATVTLGLPKIGLVTYPGLGYAGAVTVADLGFPRDLLESSNLKLSIHGPDEIGSFLPRRPGDGNKGTFGKALILAGSTGMTGAAVLAARAAGRSGAGLIYCGVPAGLEIVFDILLVEAVKRRIPSRAGGRFDEASIDAALAAAREVESVALGPGLSTEPGVAEFVRAILEQYRGALVLDADGLNVLGEEPDVLRRRPGPTIVTPHPGEMGRLIGRSARDVQADRVGIARSFAERHNVVVVLKGAQSVIAEPNGQAALNTSGNSGMAKGGSGDVLTGLIAGLLAQGLDPARAAQAGVFLHGLAGDIAARRHGVRAMTPSDMIECLGEAFQTIEKAAREKEGRRTKE
ncbi:MAG: NAD(P)H-hydrate dehydratase [Candidatus Sumerlaeota bacterium]|nr:NAD(P)H-hydrate dehydratase [Candidatus Sumerlaeota bacterium]